MSRSPISNYELFQMFPDQERARVYLEGRLWPNGVKCPVCGTGDRITERTGGYYRCNQCKEDFTVRTGTIFERSHVPLHKWIYAMYLLVTARTGISSVQLAKEIGITQKSAWFVLQRLREACGDNLAVLRGIVEVDEMFVGGKEGAKHADKRAPRGSRGGASNKIPVIGMRKRGGRTRAMPVVGTTTRELGHAVHENVEIGSTIHCDEHSAYKSLGADFQHEAVNHKRGEYVRGNVHTNSIESVWAVMKRGLHGVNHASEKHLHRYVDEFTFRRDEGIRSTGSKASP